MDVVDRARNLEMPWSWHISLNDNIFEQEPSNKELWVRIAEKFELTSKIYKLRRDIQKIYSSEPERSLPFISREYTSRPIYLRLLSVLYLTSDLLSMLIERWGEVVKNWTGINIMKVLNENDSAVGYMSMEKVKVEDAIL